MTEQEVDKVLVRVGAIRRGHFVGTSGKHLDTYIDKDMVYPHPTVTDRLCRAIAEQFTGAKVEVVIAPEKGGILLSHEVAKHLFKLTGKEVLAFYAEKTGDAGFVIKRGDAAKSIPGKRVLVVEDLLTTGSSVRKVIEVAQAMECYIVGLGVLCNRGEVTAQDVGNIPRIYALINAKLNAWNEMDCPLCKDSVPINTEVGHGCEFLARKQAQAI